MLSPEGVLDTDAIVGALRLNPILKLESVRPRVISFRVRTITKAGFIPVEFREIRSKNRSKIRVTRINFRLESRKLIRVTDVIRWHIAAPPLETVCSDTPIFLHGALESLIRELSPLARALSCRNASGTTRTPHDITHTRDGLDPTEHAHHHALTCAHVMHVPLHIRLNQGGGVARDSIHTTG